MPQLDIFIFFSQYFIFVISFIVSYLFILRILIKDTDFTNQIIKHKMVNLHIIAATLRMTFDKLTEKSKTYYINVLNLKENFSKNYIIEMIFQINIQRKYVHIPLIANILPNYGARIKNYLN